MKNLSIRTKITLWFSCVLVVIVALTFVVVLSVSNSVIQKTIRDNLIETVEDNVDEVEFFSDAGDAEDDRDKDIYIAYADGFLEIDDDYLDLVNGVYTALYRQDGALLYGEDPIARASRSAAFSDGVVQTVSVEGVTYYLYDRALELEGLEGLWLRGVVSEKQGAAQLNSVARMSLIFLPLLVAAAILGGYLIAGRALRPVQRIEQAAKEISQGRDLKKRIGLGPGGDELHRLANTFDEMFDRLDRAFAAEQQFTSDASHELRTPTSVILAQCEYALEGTCTPEDYVEALEVIQRQGRRMSRLIGDMLELTRMEQQSVDAAFEPVDFSALTEDLSGDLALLEEKGITLLHTVEAGIFVRGSSQQLTRLVTNLIGNAYRHGRENGHIWVRLDRDGENARLTVKDDGAGIAPEHQERIFDRFYQVDSARSGQGTGLGLAMAREIARSHGGSLEVESAVDVGSVFTVLLPLEKNLAR